MDSFHGILYFLADFRAQFRYDIINQWVLKYFLGGGKLT